MLCKNCNETIEEHLKRKVTIRASIISKKYKEIYVYQCLSKDSYFEVEVM
jgi:hypothetical protein